MLGGRCGLYLSVEEVTLWARLLVLWGAPETVLRAARGVGIAAVEAPAGRPGSATRRRSGSTCSGG